MAAAPPDGRSVLRRNAGRSMSGVALRAFPPQRGFPATLLRTRHPEAEPSLTGAEARLSGTSGGTPDSLPEVPDRGAGRASARIAPSGMTGASIPRCGARRGGLQVAQRLALLAGLRGRGRRGPDAERLVLLPELEDMRGRGLDAGRIGVDV